MKLKQSRWPSRLRSLSLPLLVVIALGFGSRAAGDPTSAGLVRKNTRCADYESTISGPDKKAYTPGAWGGVPPELRKLPPGAELCGADARMLKSGVTVIRSSLFGKDLEKFYGPLFDNVGCKPLACDITKAKLGKVDIQQTHCVCHGDHRLGTIATDSSSEMFVLSLVEW